nr:MAG TPA: hypothetical protein [Caudoviricetes sp.]
MCQQSPTSTQSHIGQLYQQFKINASIFEYFFKICS